MTFSSLRFSRGSHSSGYTRHHAILVSGGDWGDKDVVGYPIHRAYAKAQECGLGVTSLQRSGVNNWFTFAVVPDGSKEGWPESDAGNFYRENFIAYLQSLRYDDGSSPLDWVEVQYGDDDGETRIRKHSDEVPLPSPPPERP